MIFGFSRMRAVSTRYNDRPAEASRPFDRGRDGFVLGEGAWMYVVEARGARARARRDDLRDGRGLPLDLRRVSPRADGSRTAPRSSRAMRGAVERSDRALEEIGYVNYHGTSTQLNDAIESQCTRRVFGALADRRAGLVDQVDDWPSARRQRRGRHRGDGAGAVARVPAADRSTCVDPDPACDLDYVPERGRAARPAAALCNCLGFGSKNSAIVLGAIVDDASTTKTLRHGRTSVRRVLNAAAELQISVRS